MSTKITINSQSKSISIVDLPNDTWGQVTEWNHNKDYNGRLVFKDTRGNVHFFYIENASSYYDKDYLNKDIFKDCTVVQIESFEVNNIILSK